MLTSERLKMYPISNEEMLELINNEADPDMKQAYSEMLQGCINKPENREWYAVWLMVLAEFPDTIVGDFCFKGLNEDGMVEIGYGLREGYCGKGYMTEAVRTACAWALEQRGVSRVEAETAPDGLASQKVLLACGFAPLGCFGEEGPRFVLKRS